MFAITIDDKVYKFPKRLTVDQWANILKYDLSQTQTWPKVVSGLMGLHPKDLTDISDAQLQIAIGIIFSMLEQQRETKWKDPNTLTFGEWIDLDVWITKGVGHNANEILGILGKTKWADEASYIIKSYITWRTWIYKQYAELFGLDVEGDEIIQEEDEGPQDPNAVVNGWYSIIISLASENILNIEKVTDQPLLGTLNFMAHQKQKQIAENFKQLKQQREYELQRRR